MKSVLSRWANNSAANLIGGASSALFNIAVPAVVSRHLAPEEFSAWSLALQIIAYVNLLGLGLQTATAQNIARYGEFRDHERLLRVIRAGLSIARAAMAVACVAILLLVVFYPLLVPTLPDAIRNNFRIVILLVGLSTAMQIPALVPMGVFQGLHLNICFVLAQIVVRVATVSLLWYAVKLHWGMIGLAAIVAICSASLYPLTWNLLKRRLVLPSSYKRLLVDRETRKDLLRYCGSLSVWSVAMLLVNSTGIVIVARVDFAMSGPYSIAMTAATVLAGLLGAMFSPLITTAASMHASTVGRQALPRLLTFSTIACGLGLQLLFITIWIFHTKIIALWVGTRFVDTVSVPLLILVGSHALRNVLSPYAMMLLATGLHRKALWTGLAEGVANLIATILLGAYFGTTGIALGTLVGALVGMVSSVVVNMKNTPELTPSPVRFFFMACAAPFIIFGPAYYVLFQMQH